MQHTDKLELAARAGYGARGVVYLLIGGFAVAAAVGFSGAGDGTQDARSVLERLVGAPGRIALAAIALGLVGYAAWRAV